ncbi:MAG TPA: hypothetical protein PKY05_12465 [Fibrobacteria bacterium]|nr:hypothetical protein [Fibrobacteria bacterium]
MFDRLSSLQILALKVIFGLLAVGTIAWYVRGVSSWFELSTMYACGIGAAYFLATSKTLQRL